MTNPFFRDNRIVSSPNHIPWCEAEVMRHRPANEAAQAGCARSDIAAWAITGV